MALDPYTQLRQMGYAGTLDEMLAKYYNDITGLDTIGEQLYKALSQAMALNVLGITATGSATVSVPSGLNATGVPSPTTFLAGDGAWRVPAGSGGGGGGGSGNDPNAAHPANNEQITGVWTFTTQPVGINKASVGLNNVDNTSDAAKPISTETQTALNGKVSTTGTATVTNLVVTGTVTFPDGTIQTADISGLDAILSRVPQVIRFTAGAYAPRYATQGPVEFEGPIPPTTDGNLAGGGGAVIDRDRWLRTVS